MAFLALSSVLATAQQGADSGYRPLMIFKPASTSLTSVYAQMAESLEHLGSPVPYLQHVLAEHQHLPNAVRHLCLAVIGQAIPSRSVEFIQIVEVILGEEILLQERAILLFLSRR